MNAVAAIVFDRMLLRGYLPIMSGWSMAQLLWAHEIDSRSVKPFLLSHAERVKQHALAMARQHGRPFEYLSSKLRKEDAARKIAQRDGIDEGLVCVFSAVEPCRTWVAAQAEYSTDVMFKTAEGLRELYPRLLSHGTLCFGANEVMNFLGRKLMGRFEGKVVCDLSSLVCRRTGGTRVKHRFKQNWLKRVDKAGLVLRIETVINNAEELRVRKQVLRDGKQRAEWVALPNLGRKGVAYLFRYPRDIAAGPCTLPRCAGRGRGPHARQAGAAASDHDEEGMPRDAHLQ